MFVSRRILTSPEGEAASLIHGKVASEGDTSTNIHASVKGLVQEQIKRAWEELSSGRLKVEGRTAGTELAKTLVDLHKLRPGMWHVSSIITHGPMRYAFRSRSV